MIGATITVSEEEVRKRLGTLANKSGKVMARAANRAYKTGKTAIAKETARRYLIRQKDINDKNVLKEKPATEKNPTATLVYTGGHRNLYLWNNNKAVSPNKIIHWSHGKPNVNVYSAAVMKGHGKIKLYGDANNKPFIQRVRKGEKSEFVGLFQRRNEDRKSQLVSVQAPAIPQILKNAGVMEQFERSAGPMFQKRLEHEIERVLKGAGK